MKTDPKEILNTSPEFVMPSGEFITRDNQEYYVISNYSLMPSFFMSLANNSDLWMFISSSGGLTAGRIDAQSSIFPYITVNQLHDAHHHTGPITLIRIKEDNGKLTLWKPFATSNKNNPQLQRKLYKNTIGNRVIFEETNIEHSLTFTYSWTGSDKYGWVKTSSVTNISNRKIDFAILDGLRNILPHGADLSLYQTSSNLVDAYKKSEIDTETSIGIFSLTSGITDKTEALEILTANTVWCCGLEGFRAHLDIDIIDKFKTNKVLSSKNTVNGTRGNYLISSEMQLEPGQSKSWKIIANVGQSHKDISDLRLKIYSDVDLEQEVMESISTAEKSLLNNIGSSDGIQKTSSLKTTSHHFANVLFNNMRGGVFDYNYNLPTKDILSFLQTRNKLVFEEFRQTISESNETIIFEKLVKLAETSDNKDFLRLCYEYLPLYFSRRHGDPSRPWNHFSIQSRNQNGERVLYYEGNWRDIFQNWEALTKSFPGFIRNIITIFVNASTVDGFNPYRITKDGIDWETVNEGDSWSNIGYWGDHQIVYLLKLLESIDKYDNSAFGSMLTQDIFSYASVPYIIKSYQELVQNTQETIQFDIKKEEAIAQRVSEIGTDGKLVADSNGAVYRANMLEKLLVPALSKISNLIPEAGIWMNTQRPEWNDANNALGGGGSSVVTLCYLNRYLGFVSKQLDSLPESIVSVSNEVNNWLEKVDSILNSNLGKTQSSFSAEDRKSFQDQLGTVFSEYRKEVYKNGFSGKTDIDTRKVSKVFKTALEFTRHSIKSNRREDGLYHAYNVPEYSKEYTEVDIVRLPLMLEGQVAVLSSGILTSEESLEVLEKMYLSQLFRKDQNSFVLYPEKTLPSFLEKNTVPENEIRQITLINKLLSSDDTTLIYRDALGVCRFNSSIQNKSDLVDTLDCLMENKELANDVGISRDAVLGLFETVFNHQSHTGRSGVMYRYEGIGCIYWHMVAKLLLAVQEIIIASKENDTSEATYNKIVALYYKIRSGLGFQKNVTEFGAFPMDPYSHTPSDSKARQPGMTGQVKEEIITRMGELGIQVIKDELYFRPFLLKSSELLDSPTVFEYYNVDGEYISSNLPAKSLAFTVCQTLVVYRASNKTNKIKVKLKNEPLKEYAGVKLSRNISKKIFSRSGEVEFIEVILKENDFLTLFEH